MLQELMDRYNVAKTVICFKVNMFLTYMKCVLQELMFSYIDTKIKCSYLVVNVINIKY